MSREYHYVESVRIDADIRQERLEAVINLAATPGPEADFLGGELPEDSYSWRISLPSSPADSARVAMMLPAENSYISTAPGRRELSDLPAVPGFRLEEGVRSRARVAISRLTHDVDVLDRQIGPTDPETEVLEVRVLDVGQGDSVLVTFPNGQRWLVDANNSPTLKKSTERSIAALRKSGQLSGEPLDLAIVTHPHSDHVRGFRDLMRAGDVRTLAIAQNARDEYEHLKLLRWARENAVEVRWCGRRSKIPYRVGSVLVRSNYRRSPATQLVHERNLGLSIEWGDACVLLAGDLDRSKGNPNYEDQLGFFEDRARTSLLMYKAAHHGSAECDHARIVRACGSRAAVFTALSCSGSSYNHPSQEAVSAISGHSLIGRTDRDGEVVARFTKVPGAGVMASHSSQHPAQRQWTDPFAAMRSAACLRDFACTDGDCWDQGPCAVSNA